MIMCRACNTCIASAVALADVVRDRIVGEAGRFPLEAVYDAGPLAGVSRRAVAEEAARLAADAIMEFMGRRGCAHVL